MNDFGETPNFQDIAIVTGQAGLENRTASMKAICHKVGH